MSDAQNAQKSHNAENDKFRQLHIALSKLHSVQTQSYASNPSPTEASIRLPSSLQLCQLPQSKALNGPPVHHCTDRLTRPTTRPTMDNSAASTAWGFLRHYKLCSNRRPRPRLPPSPYRKPFARPLQMKQTHVPQGTAVGSHTTTTGSTTSRPHHHRLTRRT